MSTTVHPSSGPGAGSAPGAPSANVLSGLYPSGTTPQDALAAFHSELAALADPSTSPLAASAPHLKETFAASLLKSGADIRTRLEDALRAASAILAEGCAPDTAPAFSGHIVAALDEVGSKLLPDFRRLAGFLGSNGTEIIARYERLVTEVTHFCTGPVSDRAEELNARQRDLAAIHGTFLRAQELAEVGAQQLTSRACDIVNMEPEHRIGASASEMLRRERDRNAVTISGLRGKTGASETIAALDAESAICEPLGRVVDTCCAALRAAPRDAGSFEKAVDLSEVRRCIAALQTSDGIALPGVSSLSPAQRQTLAATMVETARELDRLRHNAQAAALLPPPIEVTYQLGELALPQALKAQHLRVFLVAEEVRGEPQITMRVVSSEPTAEGMLSRLNPRKHHSALSIRLGALAELGESGDVASHNANQTSLPPHLRVVVGQLLDRVTSCPPDQALQASNRFYANGELVEQIESLLRSVPSMKVAVRVHEIRKPG